MGTNTVMEDQTNGAELELAIRKTLGSFALDFTFTAPAGITVLFGPSGSGKTTVLDCVAGLKQPDSGRIAIGDRVLFDSGRHMDLRTENRGVAYVLQDLALFPHLSVRGNVEYGLAALPSAVRRERAELALETFHISELSERKPRDISGGQRQRVALARALVTAPSVLLLDEPLTGLDLPTRSRLLDDLRKWNEAHRIPILYVTHSHKEVMSIGERVVAVEAGKILGHGAPHVVLRAPRYESVEESSGLENLLDSEIIGIDEEKGIALCRAESDETGHSADLEVPLVRARVGEKFRIAIDAGDILVATKRPEGISARNILAGTVINTVRRDTIVSVEVDCGVRFKVHVTPAAESALHLRSGQQVWLIIKTHSCRLLRP